MSNLVYNGHLAGIAGLLLGMTSFLVPVSVFGQAAYQGSEYCIDCHASKYNDWSASGHPYIMMKAEDARNRPIPLPAGKKWSDISYVIGGYGPKSLYLDNNGYIITSPGNQYNYHTGQFTGYHVGEANLAYDCAACHTTNYMMSGNQDGLPGILGTFDAAGVQCEQCHGNGMTMDADTPKTAAFCGTCHTSGESSAVIPAMDGFIMSNGQYNELLAGPHASMDCVSCHNPHKSAEFGIIRECETCHANKVASYTAHSMSDYGVECKDCHMPNATLSGQAQGTFEGDRKTHLFYINTDDQANMFTPDGSAVSLDFAVPGKPEKVNKGAVTLDYACKRCHETADMSELGKFARNFHGRDASVSQLEYIGINPGLTGNWWGGSTRSGEGYLLEVAYSNGALTLIVSFYTYDSAGNQVYLIAVGSAANGMTSNVDVFITEGRKWGAAYKPADGSTPTWGTGTFTFTSCSSGSFTLTPNATYKAKGFTDLGYELFRDIAVPGIACPTFVNNTK
jgi:hypothetical protein